MKRMLCMGLAVIAVGMGFADEADPCMRTFIDPVRVVWTSPGLKGSEVLLSKRFGQVSEGAFSTGSGCLLENNGEAPGVLVDFGRELHGGLQIGCGIAGGQGMKLHVRFGESVAEAMSALGERCSGNDHAIRDSEIAVPWFGTREIGNTGFRFVRVDLVTKGKVNLEFLRAISVMRPMQQLGSFKSSDARLDKVWATAARTAHLCCQDYIWDGIKRDRLVWQGDMHPELTTVLAVFGTQDVLTRSLEYMRATTPADGWMNGMPSYTLWWIRCQHDYYLFSGDRTFLAKQHDYMKAVFANLSKHIGADGSCKLKGFLDWPTQHNPEAIAAGMQALMLTAFENGEEMAAAMKDEELTRVCADGAAKLRTFKPAPAGSKQAAAMLALAGLQAPQAMWDEVLAKDGVKGVSTFYGYYMLEAMSAAGHDQAALDTVRDYWGAMLDVGATSFWEDFNVAWTNNCFHIDELPVAGKKDIHGDYGEFCYKGFRHSLCHGWSSGPAAWILHHVLGIQPMDVGCKTVRVKPFLGDLQWAEGALPIPQGLVKVRVTRKPDGSLDTVTTAPDGVKIVK